LTGVKLNSFAEASITLTSISVLKRLIENRRIWFAAVRIFLFFIDWWIN